MFKQITAIASAAAIVITAATPAMAKQQVIQMQESIAPIAEKMEKAAEVFADVAPVAFAPRGDILDGMPMFYDWGRHDGDTGFAFQGLTSAKARSVIFDNLKKNFELSCSSRDMPQTQSIRGELIITELTDCRVEGLYDQIIVQVNTSVSLGRVVTARLNWTL